MQVDYTGVKVTDEVHLVLSLRQTMHRCIVSE